MKLVILGIILAQGGLVGLSYLGIDLLPLRWVVGFIFITFVPGYLILRILGLQRLGFIEKLLYTVGLSVAFAMFLGWTLNWFLPLIGIAQPISVLPLLVAFSVSMLIMWGIAYPREEPEIRLKLPTLIKLTALLKPQALCLLGLPILTIIGTRIVFANGNNLALLVMLSLVVVVAMLIATGRLIPPQLYPLAVLTISISLLFHLSLISNDLFGGDVGREFLYQDIVIKQGYWDTTLKSNLNAMMSITILCPVYSIMLKLSSIWVFKVVYMLLFSLVPLALYQAYQKLVSSRVAFLAVFFFMSFPVFFTLAPDVRQPSAEVFLALTLLLFIEKEIPSARKTILLIIFGFAIIVSHYGLTYIYIFYLGATIPLLFLKKSAFRPVYALVFVGFALLWFTIAGGGSPFQSLLNVINKVQIALGTVSYDIMARNPHILQAFGLAPMRGAEITWEIARGFQYAIQLFIVVGAIGMIAKWHKLKSNPTMVVMCLASLVLLGICVVVPVVGKVIRMMRVFHITLFFLAPICVLGGLVIGEKLFRLRRWAMPALTIILVPYFLFTTGFIFEVTNTTACSMPLSLYEEDWAFNTDAEVEAREWLYEKVNPSGHYYGVHTLRKYIYTDAPSVLMREMRPYTAVLKTDLTKIKVYSYIYLRRWNVERQEYRKSASTGAEHYPLSEIWYLDRCEIVYIGEPGYPVIYFIPDSVKDIEGRQ